MNRRDRRLVHLALLEATKSDHDRVKIGAVIVKGNRVVSTGYNTTKSHPLQLHYNQLAGRLVPKHSCHAELAAIINAGRHDLSGTKMYVARRDRVGRLANCRPCGACRLALERAGITDVAFTNQTGLIQSINGDIQ